jgi:uncharacterized protein
MNHRNFWIAFCALLLLAAALLVPLRHSVRLERSGGNPVQHVVLESRSLLGLRRSAWGVKLAGADVWGNSKEGFFLAPRGPVSLQVQAWPRFQVSLSITPVMAEEISVSPLGEGDREAFRAWFVAILEQQLEGPSPAWEPAQRDCAGILRFAFREAWGPHTEAWRDRVGFAVPPVASDPSPLLAGPWRRAFPTPEGWNPFAKGAFLRDYACVKLGRDMVDARPGDVIFFARGGARSQPDHAMALVRPGDHGQPMLLYHTGPETTGGTKSEGEVRRVSLDELLHHPDPEFRPLPENPAFLGVYRWKVLCSGAEQTADQAISEKNFTTEIPGTQKETNANVSIQRARTVIETLASTDCIRSLSVCIRVHPWLKRFPGYRLASAKKRNAEPRIRPSGSRIHANGFRHHRGPSMSRETVMPAPQELASPSPAKQAAPILDRRGLGPKALDGPGPHLKHLYSRLFAAFAVDLFKRSHADNQESFSNHGYTRMHTDKEKLVSFSRIPAPW